MYVQYVWWIWATYLLCMCYVCMDVFMYVCMCVNSTICLWETLGVIIHLHTYIGIYILHTYVWLVVSIASSYPDLYFLKIFHVYIQYVYMYVCIVCMFDVQYVCMYVCMYVYSMFSFKFLFVWLVYKVHKPEACQSVLVGDSISKINGVPVTGFNFNGNNIHTYYTYVAIKAICNKYYTTLVFVSTTCMYICMYVY